MLSTFSWLPSARWEFRSAYIRITTQSSFVNEHETRWQFSIVTTRNLGWVAAEWSNTHRVRLARLEKSKLPTRHWRNTSIYWAPVTNFHRSTKSTGFWPRRVTEKTGRKFIRKLE